MDLSKTYDCLLHGLIIVMVYGSNKTSYSPKKAENRFLHSLWNDIIRGVPVGSISGPLCFC